MKRVRVRWHTTEVTDYEAVFEVPDSWSEKDLRAYPNFEDGDCDLLVGHEDAEYEQHGNRYPSEFTRETDAVELLP